VFFLLVKLLINLSFEFRHDVQPKEAKEPPINPKNALKANVPAQTDNKHLRTHLITKTSLKKIIIEEIINLLNRINGGKCVCFGGGKT
jgi:hypothetical protein